MPAPNTNPIFPITPVFGQARISTANTNRDGTGTLGSVYTAGSMGARIERINIKAVSSTTAGMIRLFVDDAGTIRFFDEVPVTAIPSPSGSIETFQAEVVRTDGRPALILPPSAILKAGTHVAEVFDITVPDGGNY